ncbi:MAG: hypothetical protein ACYSWZ_18555 [Planctomycetota bacterium]|jgi:hypothetical protein
MDEVKKPSMQSAIPITVAALLDLFAAILLASTNTKPELLMTIVLCEIILIAGAIAAWIKYFKSYVNFAIEQKLREINKKSED